MTTSSKSTVICDADFLVALHIDEDSNHQKALAIYNKYTNFVVSNVTLYEVATVLSRLMEHTIAKTTLNNILLTFDSVIYVDKIIELEVYRLYQSFSKKNISFFDCAVLQLAQSHGYLIASFDKFYPSELLVF